jgi:hypothetical protein
MRFYAERPGRLTRQIIADLLAVAWAVVLVLVALAVRDLILALQMPARSLAQAGDSITGTFDGAARTAGGIPFVGPALARALGQGTSAGTNLGDAGRQTVDVVAGIATGSAVAIVVVGVLPLLFLWLPLRLRYARAARSALAARDLDEDLLALRAMTRLPARTLLSTAPDPAAAWRRGDPATVRALAALELASLGLRGPSGEPPTQAMETPVAVPMNPAEPTGT